MPTTSLAPAPPGGNDPPKTGPEHRADYLFPGATSPNSSCAELTRFSFEDLNFARY